MKIVKNSAKYVMWQLRPNTRRQTIADNFFQKKLFQFEKKNTGSDHIRI